MSQTKTAIDHREYGFIMNSRYSSFSEDGVLPFTPIFIDPILHLATLSALYMNAVENEYYAIRIYPGLTQDNQLVMITCDAVSSDSNEEVNYRIFHHPFFMQPNSLPPLVSFDEAQDCHRLFISRVKVEGDVQPPIGTSVPHIRKSKTLEWTNIREFVEENIPNADLRDPQSLGNYLIKLETGYIPSYLQSQFLTRQPVSMPDHLRGFCVVCSLLTENGIPLIKANQLVDENAQRVYENNYLDLMKSCPPSCGTLDW
ncbi:MAG: hypothetical protein U0Y08_14495 [Bacteroidia bacterium]